MLSAYDVRYNVCLPNTLTNEQIQNNKICSLIIFIQIIVATISKYIHGAMSNIILKTLQFKKESTLTLGKEAAASSPPRTKKLQ